MTPEQLRSGLVAYLARHGREPRIGLPWVLRGGRAGSLHAFAHDGIDGLPATSVIKMYPPTVTGREHATREWRALTGLRAAGCPTPRALLLETDARHLGHPFVVMDHVAGMPLWDVVQVAGPARRTELTGSFVAQLVALHALDPDVLEPEATRRHLEREIEALHRDSAGSPAAAVVRWLEDHAPAPTGERPVIQHRDYHPWNVLVDAAGHLWVLDWDWGVGDARFDLAWTRTLMRRSGFTDFADAVRDEYARRSGRPLDDLGYFEVLTTLRWLLNVRSASSNVMVDDAEREDFCRFLVEPVRHAQGFLREHTGIDLDPPSRGAPHQRDGSR